MKVELYALYVGHAVFYFDCPMTAAIASSSLAGSYSADSAADPDAPHTRVTLAPVSPRVERIFLDVPNRRRLRLRAPHASALKTAICSPTDGGHNAAPKS
jgi:hypothetical protein